MADKKRNFWSTLIFYFRLWQKYTLNAFSAELASRFTAIIFLLAKILRFFFFFFFLILIAKKTQKLAGFDVYQLIFFFLTFNFIDNVSQFLYREVYRFRFLIINGHFDYVLLKPINSLFRVLFGGADVLDFLLLIPSFLALVYVGFKLPNFSFVNIFFFILLLLNAFILVTSFHIFVLAVGILTTTVDHTIMIYRDISSMGRVPVDIYREPLRSLLTFVLPVGITMTFPAKAMMGLLSFYGVIFSLLLGIVFFYLSLKFWHYALTKYTSASS